MSELAWSNRNIWNNMEKLGCLEQHGVIGKSEQNGVFEMSKTAKSNWDVWNNSQEMGCLEQHGVIGMYGTI